jgi:hypothetical protein
MNNINKGEGFTTSERYLANLCEKSFLSLWSYPSIFRDQGKSGNASSSDGKEVTDSIVIFGDHVIIFSDKDCQFIDYGDPILNWKRWYKKAILKSAEQVWGAERWIKNHPDRLFIDNKCQHKLPFEVPTADKINVHRIVVAHNISDECKRVNNGSGSLRIDTAIVGKAHFENQNGLEVQSCAIGMVDPTRGYVHVLDDVTLEILLNNLDTITDFIQYLERKEKLVLQRSIRVIAAGEEDILAYYLKDIDEEGKHEFILQPNIDTFHLQEGIWEEFSKSRQFTRQQEEDERSYAWDRLIEFVSEHFTRNTLYFSTDPSFKSTEFQLRTLAQESRLGRRILADALFGLASKSAKELAPYHIRVLDSDTSPKICYVFFLLDFTLAPDYTTYRDMRRRFIETVCRIVKLRYVGDKETIVGIGTEGGGTQKIHSFDVLTYNALSWEEGEKEHAIDLFNRSPFLKNAHMYYGRDHEYPED